MPLSKFESMLKTNSIYFFDLAEFEEIIIHYLDTGKHSLAKKAVKLGLEQHPTSVDLRLLEVEILIFDDHLELASKKILKIEQLVPNNEEVYIQKATILSKSGRHREAIQNLKIALIHTDDKQDIWSMMGMEYLYIDDFDNARLSFSKCIDNDYEDYSALYNVVYCFDMVDKHEEAIHFLNQYVDKNPYCEVAWHQLGRQYFTMEMYKEALSCFDYAVLIDESFLGAYLEKAKIYEQLEDYENAIKNYSITLELDDPTAFACLRVGECYQQLGKNDLAATYYKKAVHEDPLQDKGWILLTDLCYEEKNYNKALYYVTKALKIDNDHSVYWRKYADINLELDLYQEAVKGFETCLRLGDESLYNFIALSDLLILLEHFNDAVDVLHKARKLHETHAEIEYRLSGLFFILSKPTHGTAHLALGMKIDYEYHAVIKELFPLVFQRQDVQQLLENFNTSIK